MSEDRKDRFVTPAAGMLIIPRDGREPYRADGSPLTDHDREWLAGRDPYQEQLDRAAREDVDAE